MLNSNRICNIISSTNLDGVYTIIDDVLFVNCDYLVNRSHQIEGLDEYLYTVSEMGNGKIVVFLFRDGINPVLSGMGALIEHTINILNLDENACYLYGYPDININKATNITLNYAQVWITQCFPYIKHLPLATSNFTKKFAGLFGRHDIYRLKICKHLWQNHGNDSLISYNTPRATWNSRFQEYFSDDAEWFKTHCPIRLDFDGTSGWVSFRDSLNQIGQHYEQYFIEVVAETDPHSSNFFTEKTVKNLYLGKPFLLLSGQGGLKYLQDMGFKTFSPWINESYDTLSSVRDRLDAILAEIDRLGELPNGELQKIHAEMATTLMHNRQLFEELSVNPVSIRIGKK
jgi:hypothetical protein